MEINNFIKIEDLYKKTNNGLDIFLHYYPTSVNSVNKKNGKFKIREEKIPSTNLYQDKNIWYLKDHGSGKRINAIDLVMEQENVDFKVALFFINQSFLNGQLSRFSEIKNNEAEFVKVKKADKFEIIYNKQFSKSELAILGKM